MNARAAIRALILCAAIAAAPAFAGPPEPVAPETWLTIKDNLPEANKLGLDGVVSAELSISATGRVTACTIVQSSGHGVLDEHTCKLLVERARFKPATDENGQLVAGTYVHSTRWQAITLANWAKDGFVRAEARVDLRRKELACSAQIHGEMSTHMEQMACFLLVNQVRNIVKELSWDGKEPFRAIFILEVRPEGAGKPEKDAVRQEGLPFAFTKAELAVTASGMRSDCRMLASEGPPILTFPVCTQTPVFRYVPGKDAAGADAPTVFRQEIAYYVLFD